MADIQPPFWLVWRAGCNGPCPTHTTYFDARAEAEQLSKANPGFEFFVMAPAARGVIDDQPVWSHFTPSGIATLDDLADHPTFTKETP